MIDTEKYKQPLTDQVFSAGFGSMNCRQCNSIPM